MHLALTMYDLGWNVMPLIGKRPIAEWGALQRHQADREKLEQHFADRPDYNTAVICGEVSGVSVIDIDVGTGLDQEALLRFYRKFPTPICVRTGGGGWHFYYRYAKVKNSVKVKYPGLNMDVRSQGGYVVAPPSVHPDNKRTYYYSDPEDPTKEFDAEMIATLRENLPDFPEEVAIQCRADAMKTPDDWRAKVYATNEGSRNANAASVAGKLMGALPTRDWYPFVWPLLQAWNKEYVQPPLTEPELKHVFDSISKSALRRKQWDDATPTMVEMGTEDPEASK